MTNESKQTSFNFEPNVVYTKADFMVSECNVRALKAVELWPEWPFFALSIYGPKGSGKTHLAHIFEHNVSLKLNKPVNVEIVQASEIKTKKVVSLYNTSPCLVVENVTSKIDEEALFHLYNLYQNEGGYILFTSVLPLSRINFNLPDLKSRLKMVPSIAILEPSDDMLEALIVKLFTDRQIVISSETLNYIIQNMERSFSYALKLVKCCDELSLSMKRAVNVPIVKKAITQISHNTQQELF